MAGNDRIQSIPPLILCSAIFFYVLSFILLLRRHRALYPRQRRGCRMAEGPPLLVLRAVARACAATPCLDECVRLFNSNPEICCSRSVCTHCTRGSHTLAPQHAASATCHVFERCCCARSAHVTARASWHPPFFAASLPTVCGSPVNSQTFFQRRCCKTKSNIYDLGPL
jgi:hypothetical protein